MKTIITALFAIFVALTANAQLTDWQNLSNKDFVMRIIHDENYVCSEFYGLEFVKFVKFVVFKYLFEIR